MQGRGWRWRVSIWFSDLLHDPVGSSLLDSVKIKKYRTLRSSVVLFSISEAEQLRQIA